MIDKDDFSIIEDTEASQKQDDFSVVDDFSVIEEKKKGLQSESAKPLQQPIEPSATPTKAVKGVGTTTEFGEPAIQLEDVEITPKEEKPTFTESVKGSYDNFINQLKSFVPNTQIAAASVWEGVLGKELANKWYNLEGRDIDEVRSNAYAKLDELQKEYQPTRGLIESAKALDAAGFSAALIDAVSAIGSTAITSGATLGGGLITDMVGRSIADYNTEKAKTKGKTVDDLYKEGEADVMFPTIVGLVGAGLEGVGLKGAQQAIISKITPLAAKQFAKFGWEANKEGLTEYTQTILEEVNKGVAQGKSGEEVAQIALNTAMSEQAAEAYLKGVAGSAGVAIGAKVAKSGYKSLTKEESQNLNDAIKTDKGVSIASAVNKAVNSGVMDAAQGMGIVSALKPRIETVNNLPAAVADNQQAVEAVTEIKQLESKKQGLNEIESAFVDAQINDLQKTVAIPLPSKYVNSAGMNTSELKDGQLYIQKDGSVKSWDATNEKFLDKSPLTPKSQKPKANVSEVLNQIYELEQSKRFENEDGKKKVDEEIERLKQSIRGTSEEGGKQVIELQPAKVEAGTEVELEPTITQEAKVLDEPKTEVKEVEKAEVAPATETTQEVPPVVEQTTADGLMAEGEREVAPAETVSETASEQPEALSSAEATAKALEGRELKNDGKADAPTKENVQERLNINNPFYEKVEDALVKLGLIEKYNPEAGTGDVVGGYAQATSDGGISAGKMMFNKDGSISYFDGDVKVSFDKNGNVISENTKEVAVKKKENEIKGKKEAIANLEKTRDSENFKYKEVTETDLLGNRKKVRRLKTAQELKESTDKINAAIDKAKSELAALEAKFEQTEEPIVVNDITEYKALEENGYQDWFAAKPITQKGTSAENVSLTNEGNKLETVDNKGVEASENPSLKDVESTSKALEALDKQKYKQLASGSKDVSIRGVKFSDIFIGDTLLDDLISNLNEEDKRQVKEIFSRGVDYFEFNDAEQKAWEDKFTNPEDFQEVFDMLSTSELGRSSAYQNYNDRNYTNVKDAIRYILQNKNEYSGQLVSAVEKINNKLENPKNSMQRLYAVDIEANLGFSKSPKQISEAYHKAKADGSNPELVKAVETLLGKQAASTTVKETLIEAKSEQSVAELAKQRIEGEQIMEGAEDANRKAIQERDARQQEAERTAEGRKPKAKRELTPIQEAMARLKKAKKERDSAYDVGKLGTALDPFEQAKKRSEADKELFDAYVGLAKEYIKQGVSDVKAFAKEIGEDVTDVIKGAWETAKGDVEKTLVTERAYMGKFREDVKRELEKIGLTREVGSQKEAENKAREVIDTVGMDAALDAVRSGDITNGDVEAAIYFLSIEDLGKQIDQSKDEVNIASLVSMQAALLNELGEQQTRAGQFSAIAQRFYTNSDLGYKAEVKAREWKNEFGVEPSEELMQKWRERDKEFAELNKKLKEAEAKAKEAEEKAAMSNIKQSVDNEIVREKKKAQPKIYGKTRIAKGLDDLASALGAKLSAVGDERAKVTKALKDIGLGLIEEGVATTKNVAQKIREYLDANFKGKIDFDQYETDVVSEITGISTEDGLKVPHSLIRQFVKDGIDNIDDLTKAVHDVVSQADPSITERQVRDAITGYGKVVMPNKDEIERSIRKMKRVGRIVSALEDIKQKKRPLKSGKQRDALEADERRLLGELREAMKELPADDETKANELRTRLDATKRRLENQIEDLEYEIETKEALPKSDKTTVEDDEVRQLKAKRDALKKERDLIIRDAEVVEAKRLEMAKKRAKQRIEDYERRLREGDFSKKVVKPVIADTELVKLNAEKLRLKEEYDKEFYKEKLRNRTDAEKRKDIALEVWNIPRVLMATGEWSFIGIQGIKQSIAHPTYAVKAFKNALMAMSSEKKTEAWLREIKSQEWYPIMKESKLALTEPNAELTAREELFYSGWTNFIWDNLGKAILSPTRFGGKQAYEKAVQAWSNANPIKATERASVGYLDTLRVMRFLDAMQILEEKGMTFQENKQDYKDAADVINTLTGRASLGKLEQNAQLLSKLFFSPRNWASAFKTATPYALVYFSKMTPTARKMALADMSKFLGLTTSMVALAALSLNNDDDDETSVELDPRSTDFAKIKIGNTRIDPWGGMQQQIVLSTRLISDAIMKGFALAGKESPIEGAYKKGDEVLPLGVPYKTPSEFDLIVKQAANKLNPTASILYNFSKTKLGKEGKLVNEYGQEYTLSEQFSDKFYPIFWGTANELLKDDPTALDGLLTFYAFFGGGVQIYETKQSKSTTPKPAKPLQPAKPIKPIKPLKP